MNLFTWLLVRVQLTTFGVVLLPFCTGFKLARSFISKLVHSQSLMFLAGSPLPSLAKHAPVKGRTARARQILSQEKSNVNSQWIVKKK